MEIIQHKIDLQDAVGKNYDEFLFSKKRYLVCKGSRGSKKSTTTALKFAYMIPYYYFRYGVKPNLLVIRRYMNTNWNSTRAQLIWAINKLGMVGWW